MTVSGPYRFTYWREPDTEKRCAAMHPAFPSTRCNRTSGHQGEHRYTSPADGRHVEWPDEQDVF